MFVECELLTFTEGQGEVELCVVFELALPIPNFTQLNTMW